MSRNPRPPGGAKNRSMTMELLCLLSTTPVPISNLELDLGIVANEKFQRILAAVQAIPIRVHVQDFQVWIDPEDWERAKVMAMGYSNSRTEPEHQPAIMA